MSTINNRNPKISVLMSIYKENSLYVRQAIDSILNQSFGDFEFLIYNDNPEDFILDKLVLEIARKDSRIQYQRNEKNIGLAATLNRQICVAKGEYLARMDADDISLPDRFIMQVEYLDRNTNIAVLGTWAKIIDKEGQVISSASLKTGYNNIIACAMCDSPLFHPSVMIRKEFLQLNGLSYNEDFSCAQDYELWSRILFEKGGYIDNLSVYLIYYRVTTSQISSIKQQQQIYNSLLVRRNNISFFLNKYSIDLPRKITKTDVCNLINRISEFKEESSTHKIYVNILFMYCMSLPRLEKIILLIKYVCVFYSEFSLKQMCLLVASSFFMRKFPLCSLKIMLH